MWVCMVLGRVNKVVCPPYAWRGPLPLAEIALEVTWAYRRQVLLELLWLTKCTKCNLNPLEVKENNGI